MNKLFLSLVFAGLSTQASANIGGVGSGGGGAVHVPAATLDQIKSTLPNARRELRQWLYGEETLVRTGRVKSDALNLIFGINQPKGARTVQDVLGDLQIEFHDTTPCYDALGNEDDGSIYTSLPGDAICISGARLTQELRADDYEYQTTALILHEVSHLLGANEAQAVEVQDYAVMGLHLIDFPNSAFNTGRIAVSLQVQEQGLASVVKIAAKKNSLKDKWFNEVAIGRYSAFVTVLDGINVNCDNLKGAPLMSLVNYQDIDEIRMAQEQLMNLYYASNSAWASEYASIFNGKASVNLADFFKGESTSGLGAAAYWPTSGQWADTQMPYIKNVKAWTDEAAAADATFKKIVDHAQAVANEASFTVVEK